MVGVKGEGKHKKYPSKRRARTHPPYPHTHARTAAQLPVAAAFCISTTPSRQPFTFIAAARASARLLALTAATAARCCLLPPPNRAAAPMTRAAVCVVRWWRRDATVVGRWLWIAGCCAMILLLGSWWWSWAEAAAAIAVRRHSRRAGVDTVDTGWTRKAAAAVNGCSSNKSRAGLIFGLILSEPVCDVVMRAC